ncbi:MAG: methylthioribulose 1-phosphate dehydratase [Gammaproteobacteria bacterium]
MSAARHASPEITARTEELLTAGRELYARGMVPATSGNFSARLSNGDILITVSGAHKGKLDALQLMLIDADGHTLDGRRSSAETALHVQLYRRFPDCNAVLHPHPASATLLSRLDSGPCVLRGYELLKALPGIDTHDCEVVIPNFPNDQDIGRLAQQVDAWMDVHDPVPAYLISGHGFYTWGASVDDTLRHVEALEFLFECELRLQGVKRP